VNDDIENLRYPIGRFNNKENYDKDECEILIARIKEYPLRLKELIGKMPLEKLSRSYREGGWTGLQLINHLTDVFVHAFIRTKWLLTEDTPVLKPYDQGACALLSDATFNRIDVSVTLLENLIIKWTYILENDGLQHLERIIIHPEYNMHITMGEMIAAYEWHAYHHLAHLKIISES
jgi:DinB family protein